MKNIEQILSMVNQVSKDSDWQAFDFFCSGKYCRLVNKEKENHIELWIEYELVGTITEVWTDDGPMIANGMTKSGYLTNRRKTFSTKL